MTFVINDHGNKFKNWVNNKLQIKNKYQANVGNLKNPFLLFITLDISNIS